MVENGAFMDMKEGILEELKQKATQKTTQL